MIRKYSISLLIITCFAATSYAQTEGAKKVRFSELPTVSDERADMTPEQYDKLVERRAKERREAQLRRDKELKEQKALEKALYDGDGTGTSNENAAQQEPGKQTDVQQDAVSSDTGADLPISQEELEAARAELEAERIRDQQAKQAEADAKAKAAKGDFSALQKLSKDNTPKVNKDYNSVRMVDPLPADSLTKAGLPLPANASMKYSKDTASAAAATSMDRQDVFLPRKISDSLFIFMLRTTCGSKPCESYSIEIFFDGTVNYHGINNVEFKGDYTTKVSKDVLRTFFDFAKDMKYYSLEDAYLAPDDNGKNPDKQYTYTIMQVKGRKKMIQDGKYDTPSELIFFHKLIEDTFSDIQWTPMGKKKEKRVSASNVAGGKKKK